MGAAGKGRGPGSAKLDRSEKPVSILFGRSADDRAFAGLGMRANLHGATRDPLRQAVQIAFEGVEVTGAGVSTSSSGMPISAGARMVMVEPPRAGLLKAGACADP